MKLDHFFVFVPPDDPATQRALADLGLTENYRRAHPGQGTANICYGFDNAFLELLWVADAGEVRSPPIQRTQLWERSRSATVGTCPFGIAWRRETEDEPVPLQTWAYTPPYLPPGMHIPVAVDSDDPRSPMMFASPGRAAPVDWPAERRGTLQRHAGFSTLSVALHPPAGYVAPPALTSLVSLGVVSLSAFGDTWSATLTLERTDREPAQRVRVPLAP